MADSTTQKFEIDAAQAMVAIANLVTNVKKLDGELVNAGQSADKLASRGRGVGASFKVFASGVKDAGIGLAKLAATAVGAVGVLQQLAKAGEKASEVKTAFRELGAGYRDLENLRKATNGVVSDLELMKIANKATKFGITRDQLAELTKVAKGASMALGTEFSNALDDITTGIARQSPMILDNLGVTIKLSDAYKKYAEAQNIADPKTLTASQKQAAVAAEVLAQGQDLASLATKESEKSARQLEARLTNTAGVIKEAAVDAFKDLSAVLGMSAEGMRLLALEMAGVRQTPATSETKALTAAQYEASRAVADQKKNLEQLDAQFKKRLEMAGVLSSAIVDHTNKEQALRVEIQRLESINPEQAEVLRKQHKKLESQSGSTAQRMIVLRSQIERMETAYDVMARSGLGLVDEMDNLDASITDAKEELIDLIQSAEKWQQATRDAIKSTKDFGDAFYKQMKATAKAEKEQAAERERRHRERMAQLKRESLAMAALAGTLVAEKGGGADKVSAAMADSFGSLQLKIAGARRELTEFSNLSTAIASGSQSEGLAQLSGMLNAAGESFGSMATKMRETLTIGESWRSLSEEEANAQEKKAEEVAKAKEKERDAIVGAAASGAVAVGKSVLQQIASKEQMAAIEGAIQVGYAIAAGVTGDIAGAIGHAAAATQFFIAAGTSGGSGSAGSSGGSGSRAPSARREIDRLDNERGGGGTTLIIENKGLYIDDEQAMRIGKGIQRYQQLGGRV